MMYAVKKNLAGPIDELIYRVALTTTLTLFCLEDCTQHGRLLALSEILTNLNGSQMLDDV